jgi:hypothetical protein
MKTKVRRMLQETRQDYELNSDEQFPDDSLRSDGQALVFLRSNRSGSQS